MCLVIALRGHLARYWGAQAAQLSRASKSYGPKKKFSLIPTPYLNKKNICYFFFLSSVHVLVFSRL